METSEIFNKLMSYSSDNKEDIKKLKPSEKMIYDLSKRGFEMSQLQEVLKTRGNQLIISSAGSGKTTSLIFKIIYDLLTGEATRVVDVNGNSIRVPEKIWVSTFLKSGAEELENNLSFWQTRLGVMDCSKAITFSTLHAEFKRALNAMGVVTNLISESENSKLLKKIVNKYSLRNGDGRELNSENLRDLESALTYTRNRLDSKRYNKPIYNEVGIGEAFITGILRDWKAARKEQGLVDFEDLQEMLYAECCVKQTEEVIKFIRDRYNFLYIDEFQDTSQIQYEILKVYGAGARSIIAIGDDDQTIYSWRGSYNGIITKQFAEDFSPTINKLSYNYRCPSNILNAVIPSIELNVDRFQKDLKSAKEGGEVRLGEYYNYRDMVNSLGELIYEDVQEGNSVAVLCRVNSDGLMPALIFDSLNKFSYTISGEGMTLDSYVGRLVVGIAKLFIERSSQAVKNVLSLLTWDKFSINNLMKVCKNNKKSFWDISDEDLSYSCPDIASYLIDWKKSRDSVGDVQTLKYIFEFYRTRVFCKDNQFNAVCKSVILSLVALLDCYDFDSVEEFLEEIDDINERLKGRKGNRFGVNVRIATVHEFKGKEADSVYIWNDSKDVFPHKNCDCSVVEEYEEERRVHYIACTRARHKSTIMCLKNHQGDFVKEMDLSGASEIAYKHKISGSLEFKNLNSEFKRSFRKFKEACVMGDDNEFWEGSEAEFAEEDIEE